MKLRAPAELHLRRAQVLMLLAALITTFLTTPLGVVLLVARGSENVSVVAGILVLAFCASGLCGFVLGAIFLRRGASLVRMQSDFLSSVSHELRTPMTSIRMFVENLQDDRLTDRKERERALSILHREVVRLDALVARLIELSRIEGSEQSFARERVDVTAVCEAAVDAASAIDLERPFEVELAVEPGLKALGDQAALVQVVTNLLTNARKYGGDSAVVVRAAAIDREIEIAVADHGPGVPVEDQARIFGTFQRGSGVGRIPGSGMGLAIVEAIVRAHRGRVWMHPTPGGGATFRVRLPRARFGQGAA